MAVVSPIFMKDSIQRALIVTSRNVLMSSEAFLVPYKEIFQFIEDIVSVRVNYALTRGDKALADQVCRCCYANLCMFYYCCILANLTFFTLPLPYPLSLSTQALLVAS